MHCSRATKMSRYLGEAEPERIGHIECQRKRSSGGPHKKKIGFNYCLMLAKLLERSLWNSTVRRSRSMGYFSASIVNGGVPQSLYQTSSALHQGRVDLIYEDDEQAKRRAKKLCSSTYLSMAKRAIRPDRFARRRQVIACYRAAQSLPLRGSGWAYTTGSAPSR